MIRRLAGVCAALLLAACADGPAEQGPMDGIPGRTTQAVSGWLAQVEPGGRLQVLSTDGAVVLTDDGVLAELAFSAAGDRLAYARYGPDTDLVVQRLPPAAKPELVLADRCARDRPLFSPDGSRLAYVSGCSGIASVWMLDLGAPDLEIQLTNVGLERAPRVPGAPPEGFVPPPDGNHFVWTDAGLEWTADGRLWQVVAP